MENEKSLQEIHSPQSQCFGCGPQNIKGLRIRSFPKLASSETICLCHWKPEPHHQAFTGILNGGIIGALLDCHSNWTAAYHLMKSKNLTQAPCTVTADYSIQLLRPTPMTELELEAKVVNSSEDRATVEATLTSGGKITAKCRGTFVAVKPGHPAYHRW